MSNFGYTVWMSADGSMPVRPGLGAMETCIRAVEDCDIFFGVISQTYGSGVIPGQQSITHREFLRAIELEKPRWMLAHRNVVLARTLLRDLGHSTREERHEHCELRRGSSVIDHLGLVDLYEDATREDLPVEERTGNWVQQYSNEQDVLKFVGNQFQDIEQVRRFLIETERKDGQP